MAREPKVVERTEHRARTAFELARQNVVEGIVRETFGAAVATFGATYACDAEARRVMADIAPDEREHAELAARVAAFLDPLLTPSERATVREDGQKAIEYLRTASCDEPPSALQKTAGIPTALEARCMLDELASQVWESRLA